MQPIGGEVFGIQYSASQDDFHDARIGLDRLRWILSQQQKIGSLAYLHRANVLIPWSGCTIMHG
jgi:hypothetical protein